MSEYIISSSPHLKDKTNVKVIIYSVIAALVPAGVASVYFFGWYSLALIFTSIIFAVLTEMAIQKIKDHPITISDGSAILTGLLLSYNLPPNVPIWIPAVGAVVAIGLAKQVYGGLGENPFNPALIGRVFLMLSWPTYMTTEWIVPKGSIDALTTATPLALVKQAAMQDAPYEITTAFGKMMKADIVKDLFLGRVNGCLGETSAILLILGGLFLIYMNYIDWRIPFFYLTSFALFIWIFGAKGTYFGGSVLFHFFAGGLMLGVFFMATDPVTSPMSINGKIIFGVGCGLITAIIRIYGVYPEGTSFAILIMNAFTPLIDNFVRPKKFGVEQNISA